MSPPWIELPVDITANILRRLGTVEILETAQKVCKTWQKVCKDPSMWRVIDIHSDYACDEDLGFIDIHSDSAYDEDLVGMFRHAVDRSQDQLIDINLDRFASDELLDYIASRCVNLKRLRFYIYTDTLSYEGLTEALKRFPELESLDVSDYNEWTLDGIVEMVGSSCPLLTSFAINKRGICRDAHEFHMPGSSSEDDSEARAIARSMPKLRHLRLFENNLTNKGLEAILDGCPRLESLDLDHCPHLKLEGSALEKRLSSQIKHLRCSKCCVPKALRHYNPDDW